MYSEVASRRAGGSSAAPWLKRTRCTNVCQSERRNHTPLPPKEQPQRQRLAACEHLDAYMPPRRVLKQRCRSPALSPSTGCLLTLVHSCFGWRAPPIRRSSSSSSLDRPEVPEELWLRGLSPEAELPPLHPSMPPATCKSSSCLKERSDGVKIGQSTRRVSFETTDLNAFPERRSRFALPTPAANRAVRFGL